MRGASAMPAPQACAAPAGPLVLELPVPLAVYTAGATTPPSLATSLPLPGLAGGGARPACLLPGGRRYRGSARGEPKHDKGGNGSDQRERAANGHPSASYLRLSTPKPDRGRQSPQSAASRGRVDDSGF